jgi:hypothetical protein
MKLSILRRMAPSQVAAVAMLAFAALLAAEYSGHAAQVSDSERQLAARCKAQLRKCTSHCNLVYESKRANRVCRNRCEDDYFVCKAQPR